MARIITEETNLDSEDVVVRKAAPRERTSLFAVLVLLAFFATCAVVFTTALRAPSESVPPAAAPTATQTPATPAP